MESNKVTSSTSALHVGDTVYVTPKLPLAKGRGEGVVVYVGKSQSLLVQVKFPYNPYPMACFAKDCKKVS